MQTRSKTKAMVDYAKFERTVNLLLLLALQDLPQVARLSLHGRPEHFEDLADYLNVS